VEWRIVFRSYGRIARAGPKQCAGERSAGTLTSG
jgi:hypothetical protein